MTSCAGADITELLEELTRTHTQLNELHANADQLHKSIEMAQALYETTAQRLADAQFAFTEAEETYKALAAQTKMLNNQLRELHQAHKAVSAQAEQSSPEEESVKEVTTDNVVAAAENTAQTVVKSPKSVAASIPGTFDPAKDTTAAPVHQAYDRAMQELSDGASDSAVHDLIGEVSRLR